MAILVTFGQAHTHPFPGREGQVLDRNIVAKVKDRHHAFELFGNVWSFAYPEAKEKDKDFMQYFPRGVVDLTLVEKLRQPGTFGEGFAYFRWKVSRKASPLSWRLRCYLKNCSECRWEWENGIR